MRQTLSFLVHPLIQPVYVYVAAYGFVWLTAFCLARLLADKSGTDRGTIQAWRIALIVHLFVGLCLVTWVAFRSIPRVPVWWHIPFYLFPYLLVVFLDLFFFLSAQGAMRQLSKPKQSRNPRRRT